MRHIVMWKFRDFAEGATREVNLVKAKLLLESLKSLIPGILKFDVGIDFSRTERSFDLVLVSEFLDAETLKAYQNHPDHVRVVEFLRMVHDGRIVVDYVA
jgi:hypothetical protein